MPIDKRSVCVFVSCCCCCYCLGCCYCCCCYVALFVVGRRYWLQINKEITTLKYVVNWHRSNMTVFVFYTHRSNGSVQTKHKSLLCLKLFAYKNTNKMFFFIRWLSIACDSNPISVCLPATNRLPSYWIHCRTFEEKRTLFYGSFALCELQVSPI